VHRDVLKGDPHAKPEKQHKQPAADEWLKPHRCSHFDDNRAESPRPHESGVGKVCAGALGVKPGANSNDNTGWTGLELGIALSGPWSFEGVTDKMPRLEWRP